MPQNGYWVECMPVSPNRNASENDGGYSAVMTACPGIEVTGETPHAAIEALREKLKSLKAAYGNEGKTFPDHDNPVRPPRNPEGTNGWMSLYIRLCERSHNRCVD